MQIEIERCDRLLDPGERVGRKRVEIFHGRRPVEGAVAVHGERHAGLEQRQRCLDPMQRPSGEFRPTDLDLELGVALAHGAAYFFAERGNVVVGAIVTAARIDGDLGATRRAAVTARQQAPQRLAGRLCGEIPQRGVDQPDQRPGRSP